MGLLAEWEDWAQAEEEAEASELAVQAGPAQPIGQPGLARRQHCMGTLR
jgi:hypothetical protein